MTMTSVPNYAGRSAPNNCYRSRQLMCLQEPKHDQKGDISSETAWQNKKRKRDLHDSNAAMHTTSKQAQDTGDRGHEQKKAAAAPEAGDDVVCMEVDEPAPASQGCAKTPHAEQQLQQQQQELLKASTPAEKAELFARLQAEAASLKQHVSDMKPLAPLTTDNSEEVLCRSQASDSLHLWQSCGQSFFLMSWS